MQPHNFFSTDATPGIIHLVAPTARIMPLKAFEADGTAHLFDILRAIYYAVDHGARVINMSFSTAFVSGGAALLLQVNTRTNQQAAADALGETANELPGGLGDGRIDLYRAVSRAIQRRSED